MAEFLRLLGIITRPATAHAAHLELARRANRFLGLPLVRISPRQPKPGGKADDQGLRDCVLDGTDHRGISHRTALALSAPSPGPIFPAGYTTVTAIVELAPGTWPSHSSRYR